MYSCPLFIYLKGTWTSRRHFCRQRLIFSYMNQLTLSEARQLIEKPLSQSESGIPEWFTPDMIKFLFPITERPAGISIITPPRSPDGAQRTSVRREQDEARRKAMHTLVTNWDKSAKKIAKQLVDVLFRGGSPLSKGKRAGPGVLQVDDLGNIDLFQSLITDTSLITTDILHMFRDSAPSPRVFTSASSIGGYTVTETVGPLAMLTDVIRRKETVVIWVKEKFEISHGRRRVSTIKKSGRVVLFDRHMNIVFVPTGNASDCWQFVRGSVISLIQRSAPPTSPGGSSFQLSSQTSSRPSVD